SGMFRFLALLVLIGILDISVRSFELTDLPAEARFVFEATGEDKHTLRNIFIHYGALGEFEANNPTLFAKFEQFLGGLNTEEKAAFKQYFSNYQALEDNKNTSPALFQNVEKLNVYFTEKINSLGTEAKYFAVGVIGEYRKVMDATTKTQEHMRFKNTVNEMKAKYASAVEKYDNLSDDAKADIENHFPSFAAIFKSEKLQKFLTG
ncbi:hypothetical protein PMAYCL1PPCAC_10293, partial [Pristionchus mayeri]